MLMASGVIIPGISRNRLPRPKNQREFDSKFELLAKNSLCNGTREVLLLEQGIFERQNRECIGAIRESACSEERIGDRAADRKLSPGVDMEAKQERSGAASVSHLTRGRPQMRGSCVAIPAPPQVLLAHHLRQLKLPTFLREHEKVAAEAAREGLDLDFESHTKFSYFRRLEGNQSTPGALF
jgi:hypothetical protein